MLIIPAIDLIGGQAVRLKQGDYDQKTVYSSTPGALAVLFQEEGAEILHLVDLDAAKTGKPVNLSLLEEIRKSTSLKIEWGGGLRDLESLKTVHRMGAERLILGTVAVKDPGFVSSALELFGESSIVVGIDAKDGMVKTSGWETDSGIQTEELFEKMIQRGVRHFIFTDISKDGMMQGPATESYVSLLQKFPDIHLVASGGISSLSDLQQLYQISSGALFGAITGKALYEGKISLREATQNFQNQNN